MKWAVSWFIAFLLFLEVTPRCDLGRAAESFPEMGTRALLGLVGLVGLGHRTIGRRQAAPPKVSPQQSKKPTTEHHILSLQTATATVVQCFL